MRFAIVAATIVLLLARGATAETVSYPKDKPAFSVQLPENWRAQFQKDNLTCVPEAQDGFFVQFNEQPKAADKDLSSFVTMLSDQLNFTGVEAAAPIQGTNSHGLEFSLLVARGKMSGVDMIVTVAAFSPTIDRHFTMQSIATVALDEKHDSAVHALVDSIASAGATKKD